MYYPVLHIFKSCVEAIRTGKLIRRVSTTDKEYHFQNWFEERLSEVGIAFMSGGRNRYPDFLLVDAPEGYELKALAYPGRDRDFDSNSQVPTGWHQGRTIYYVFGRYPQDNTHESYPLLDLVICHGDFFNSDHYYIHKNESIKGFGSYGDIMIRDRKMYVVPTPFALASGLVGHHTLILPAAIPAENDSELFLVGELPRREASQRVTSYTFDLLQGALYSSLAPSPQAGKEHFFRAWRLRGASPERVVLRTPHP
jgi:hypothetical protein